MKKVKGQFEKDKIDKKSYEIIKTDILTLVNELKPLKVRVSDNIFIHEINYQLDYFNKLIWKTELISEKLD